MAISAPKGCKTPKRDRDEYRLTSADLDYMTKAAKEIWDMLVYYCNMPENRTGEIIVEGDKNCEKFENLCGIIEDIKNDLWAMPQY